MTIAMVTLVIFKAPFALKIQKKAVAKGVASHRSQVL
jgi:hypothetical protein